MSLPGKLCVGILEEDNPLKSYFRFKPLLINEDGNYTPYNEGSIYPENGCIRIVPDKNESSHFKVRMRQIGLFCVVDLIDHPVENDKIRPNKNYHGDGIEQNSFIIYSDVVRMPAPDMIFQIIHTSPEESIPAPKTDKVLLKGEDGLCANYYGFKPIESESNEEAQVQLTLLEEPCPIDQLQVFDLPGFGDETLSFAILPPRMMAKISDLNVDRTVQEEASSPPPSSPQPIPAPAVEAKSSDKPWISHDASMSRRPIDPRLSPMQRILAAQAGLNPRRGRSLQELIEEKWQHSRINQLGHPVAPVSTDSPVTSPVDAAISAVREVWDYPEMRESLLSSLSGIDEFGISMQECREITRKSAIEQQMNELEARRLELMGEMDHLRAGRDVLRNQLKQEIRRDEAKALADAIEKTQAAQATQAQYEKQAADARANAQSAQEAINALANGQFEKKLREFAINTHILDLLNQIKRKPEPVAPIIFLQKIDIGDLAQRVTHRFAAEGWQLSQKEVLNLCVCATLSPLMVLSGTLASGKTRTAQLLADALGWTEAGRFSAFGPGVESLANDARIKALCELPNNPAMILLDDANLYSTADLLRDLLPLLDNPEWRICVTVQDAYAGNPVPVSILDRAFTLRLSPQPSCASWQPPQKQPHVSKSAVSLNSALVDILPRTADALPPALIEQMTTLRKALAEHGVTLSRRALDDTWNYCGAMLSYLNESVPAAEILDMAVAQRILPTLLASAPLELLVRLPVLLKNMTACQSLLSQPFPVLI